MKIYSLEELNESVTEVSQGKHENTKDLVQKNLHMYKKSLFAEQLFTQKPVIS